MGTGLSELYIAAASMHRNWKKLISGRITLLESNFQRLQPIPARVTRCVSSPSPNPDLLGCHLNQDSVCLFATIDHLKSSTSPILPIVPVVKFMYIDFSATGIKEYCFPTFYCVCTGFIGVVKNTACE